MNTASLLNLLLTLNLEGKVLKTTIHQDPPGDTPSSCRAKRVNKTVHPKRKMERIEKEKKRGRERDEGRKGDREGEGRREREKKF